MPIAPDPLRPAPEGVSTLVHRAIDDARELASAEIALAKAKFGARATAYRNAAAYFAVAAVLALAAVVALLVGLILTLAPLVGPGGATAIVIGATIVVAGVLALIGKGKLS